MDYQVNVKTLNPRLDDANGIKANLLGRGSYGFVYRATYQGMEVAVKVLRDDMIEDDRKKELQKECSIMMQLNHSRLVRLWGFNLNKGSACLVMEIAELGSLYDILRNNIKYSHISWHRRLSFARDIILGLIHLHDRPKPILHRDLKSLNVLARKDWSAFIADFGLARAKFSSHTAGTKGIGSIPWMAPEMHDVEAISTSAVDIFSFGMILYELLTRRVPWSLEKKEMSGTQIALATSMGKRPLLMLDETQYESMRGCPAGYVDLMKACWAQKPGKRPSAIDINQRLEVIFQGLTDIKEPNQDTQLSIVGDKDNKDSFVPSTEKVQTLPVKMNKAEIKDKGLPGAALLLGNLLTVEPNYVSEVENKTYGNNPSINDVIENPVLIHEDETDFEISKDKKDLFFYLLIACSLFMIIIACFLSAWKFQSCTMWKYPDPSYVCSWEIKLVFSCESFPSSNQCPLVDCDPFSALGLGSTICFISTATIIFISCLRVGFQYFKKWYNPRLFICLNILGLILYMIGLGMVWMMLSLDATPSQCVDERHQIGNHFYVSNVIAGVSCFFGIYLVVKNAYLKCCSNVDCIDVSNNDTSFQISNKSRSPFISFLILSCFLLTIIITGFISPWVSYTCNAAANQNCRWFTTLNGFYCSPNSCMNAAHWTDDYCDYYYSNYCLSFYHVFIGSMVCFMISGIIIIISWFQIGFQFKKLCTKKLFIGMNIIGILVYLIGLGLVWWTLPLIFESPPKACNGSNTLTRQFEYQFIVSIVMVVIFCLYGIYLIKISWKKLEASLLAIGGDYYYYRASDNQEILYTRMPQKKNESGHNGTV